MYSMTARNRLVNDQLNIEDFLDYQVKVERFFKHAKIAK